MSRHPPTLLDGLERSARRIPDRVAVIDRRRIITFRQLLQAIQRLATVLAQRGEVGARIGVLLDCSIDSVVAYYACLRAGMLYAPLPDRPPDILTNVLRTLSLDAVITNRSSLGTTPVIQPETQPGKTKIAFPAPLPERPAHILLTSGTTSFVPKAVVTDQLGSIYSHAWRSGVFGYRADDVVGCNIFGIWDVVPALQHGIPVLMIPNEAMRDPSLLGAMLIRHAVTRIMMTPTLFAACLAVPGVIRALSRLRLIVLCGEIVQQQLVRRAKVLLPDLEIVNLYSIAECHDVAAAVVGPDNGSLRLTPATFAGIYLSDVVYRGRRVDTGTPGRILVSGPGLGLGYMEDHHSEAGFFDLEQPGQAPVRVYDTGDLGILHESGELEVLGRCDNRQKIRGQWVNPDHVKETLASHKDVINAAVIASEGRLSARIVLRADAAVSVEDIRKFARKHLPPPNVPGRIDSVESLAVGASGKADRHQPPGTADRPKKIDRQILDSFREVLKVDEIGPDDDFFSLGGSSLDAIALAGILETRTGRNITMANLYTHSRPGELIRFFKRQVAAEPPWKLPVLEPGTIHARTGSVVPHRILLTGASGHIGQAVQRACEASGVTEIISLTRGNDADGRSNIKGDLALPRLGLDQDTFRRLAMEVDAIVHIGAKMDPFAPYSALEPINVNGTLELIRLAGYRGLPLHFISTTSVFPLGRQQTWPEDIPDRGKIAELADLLQASGADAYSRSKLAAESLVWQARNQGLPVRVVRIPHVLGHPTRDRLSQTVNALTAAGVFPEGDWCWQFVSAETVASVVGAGMRNFAPLRHLAPVPLASARILASLRCVYSELRPVPPGAVFTSLKQVSASHNGYNDASALAQLISDYGPRAALSQSDAILASSHPIREPASTLFQDELMPVQG